ncbi:MAG TPA: hypothetical protein DHV85_13525, partial [Candidatus Accumulibacter sp.]|nr:hypothetical protein [Accumulibacter sp.]
CQVPMLLYESRALDAEAKAEIAAVTDRYQEVWQATLDELATSGRLRSSAAPLRLLLFGMLNWSSQWYRPDGALSLDEIATAAAELLLPFLSELRQEHVDDIGTGQQSGAG